MGNTARKHDPIGTEGTIGPSESLKAPPVGVPASAVLDLAEACELLKIAKVTMYGYLKRGIIPAFKYPGSRVWKFDRAELEKWLKDQQGKGGGSR